MQGWSGISVDKIRERETEMVRTCEEEVQG